MKKRLIIIGILIIVAVIAIFTAVYFASLKTVNVTLNGDSYSVSILNNKGSKVASLSKSGSIQLTTGEYSYTVNGDNYDNSSKNFSVKETTSLSITPTFSSTYLSTLLQGELASINQLLHSTYDSKSQFTVSSLALYEKGDWAAGLMTPPAPRGQLADKYRFVLHKDSNDAWTIAVPPTIAINKANYSNVPQDILYSLYSSN